MIKEKKIIFYSFHIGPKILWRLKKFFSSLASGFAEVKFKKMFIFYSVFPISFTPCKFLASIRIETISFYKFSSEIFAQTTMVVILLFHGQLWFFFDRTFCEIITLRNWGLKRIIFMIKKCVFDFWIPYPSFVNL